ncbi:MAG: hypothetical protein DCC45_02545 [Armatimonadetes bacterium]|nr:hypothetical protein [Armatimonadota bacterium]RIJ97961.1 MAG: hypothetical protein DCC45_02545 [Armatimonadota bacterium]
MNNRMRRWILAVGLNITLGAGLMIMSVAQANWNPEHGTGCLVEDLLAGCGSGCTFVVESMWFCCNNTETYCCQRYCYSERCDGPPSCAIPSRNSFTKAFKMLPYERPMGCSWLSGLCPGFTPM